ncbi:hypothetical protein [Prosthecobacter dejongeii]|uniref:Uncharacterized protein n=1 Tax=Prosthecobacter dejongeii TaxID=48465 RepID=A0A7W7YKS2_9BACT|nr:hypothetical protein [Prosthecobacter dejongeii]MBB5037904.1 hypothetical protein [Prosthecobacter dejongeii]
MDSSDDWMKRAAARLASAREDPHTAWVLDLLDWISIPLLIVLLLPYLLLIWKFRSPWVGIFPAWMGLLAWYVWGCFISPYLAMKWTGDRRVWSAFPEGPAVIAIAFVGWLPATILSLMTWMVNICWRKLSQPSKKNQGEPLGPP